MHGMEKVNKLEVLLKCLQFRDNKSGQHINNCKTSYCIFIWCFSTFFT